MKLRPQFRRSLDNIFYELSNPFNKGKVNPKSAAAADAITLGDSWLSLAINKGLIEPIEGAEDQDWFQGLSDKWKVGMQLSLFFFPCHYLSSARDQKLISGIYVLPLLDKLTASLVLFCYTLRKAYNLHFTRTISFVKFLLLHFISIIHFVTLNIRIINIIYRFHDYFLLFICSLYTA